MYPDRQRALSEDGEEAAARLCLTSARRGPWSSLQISVRRAEREEGGDRFFHSSVLAPRTVTRGSAERWLILARHGDVNMARARMRARTGKRTGAGVLAISVHQPFMPCKRSTLLISSYFGSWLFGATPWPVLPHGISGSRLRCPSKFGLVLEPSEQSRVSIERFRLPSAFSPSSVLQGVQP
jgi:hypothetical protein